MTGHPLWTNLLDRVLAPSQDRTAWLSRLDLLKGFRDRDLRHLARMLHRREFATGESIFREGDIGSGMYFIRTGDVRIESVGPDGEPRLLAILGPDQSFGEMALFDSSPRSASATAGSPCLLYGIFEGDLDQMERTRPRLAAAFIRQLGLVLSLRLRATNERLARQASNAASPA